MGYKRRVEKVETVKRGEGGYWGVGLYARGNVAPRRFTDTAARFTRTGEWFVLSLYTFNLLSGVV